MVKKRVKEEGVPVNVVEETSEPSFDDITAALEDLSSTSEDD